MIIESAFKASWWLSNPHLQTMAAKWLRRHDQFSGVKTTLETPDQDFIDLVWTEQPVRNETRPIIVLLHGLAGSVDSHYAKGMLNKIKTMGWIGCLMHFRGCSGRPNRQGPSYHSGDTRDISFLTQWLVGQYPSAPLAAIGFSLGGNVLTRFLAGEPDAPYKASGIVCAPLDLGSCSKRISSGFSKVYQKYLVDLLKQTTQEKIAMNLLPDICPTALTNIRHIRDFDHLVTAPINGFNSAEHYYEQASGKPVIKQITQPCLFIHAADDPFLDHQSIMPKEKYPEHIEFEVCRKGGHVGFITGSNPLRPVYWLEQRIPAFLAQHLSE